MGFEFLEFEVKVKTGICEKKNVQYRELSVTHHSSVPTFPLNLTRLFIYLFDTSAVDIRTKSKVVLTPFSRNTAFSSGID